MCDLPPPRKHLAHCTLACMALSGRPERYDLLRDAYNSVIDDPAETRAPPLEEWHGMNSICDAVFCRYELQLLLLSLRILVIALGGGA